MRAGTPTTHVVSAVITVVRARRAIGFVVVKAQTGAVAGVRIGTCIVGRVSA
jgi:hypothetical protein